MRLVIAEDSALLRQGLVRLLEERGYEVVGEAGDAEELLRKVKAHRPDVALLDIAMPPTHTDEGIRAFETLSETHPEIGVLVLSQHLDPSYAMRLLERREERVGYLLKDRVSDVDVLSEAIERVAAGGSAVDPAVVSQVLGRPRDPDPLADVTPREREVLGLMAEGRSNAGIAEQLVVTVRTVEAHVASIFLKLDLPEDQGDHRRVLAVLRYLRSS